MTKKLKRATSCNQCAPSCPFQIINSVLHLHHTVPAKQIKIPKMNNIFLYSFVFLGLQLTISNNLLYLSNIKLFISNHQLFWEHILFLSKLEKAHYLFFVGTDTRPFLRVCNR